MVRFLLNSMDQMLRLNIDPFSALVLAAAYAIALTALLGRAYLNYRSLPQLVSRPAQAEPPDCMVVIPARNEEGFVGRAVRSLPPDSVLVVDDGSTDGTAKEAEAAGAGVLRAPKLAKGVFGKPHACMIGANAITSKWVLFADADTWYEKGLLESAIHAAEANELSFLSIHLKLSTSGFAEHLIAPYMQALFFAGVEPRTCPESVFYGQCVLVRRSAHEFIGGFGAGLSFLVDDVKLALLAQRHRMRFGTARTAVLGHASSHRGWGGLADGIRRNAHRFMLIPARHALMLALTALVAALWLPMALVAMGAGWWPLALAVAALPLVLLVPWFGPGRALLAPVAVYAILPILGYALAGTLSTTQVRWKGRDL